MARSLRRAVIGWYALLFLAAFSAFGAALYLRVQRAMLAQVDSALEGHARAIFATIEFDLFSGWEVGIADLYLAELAREGWYEVSDPKGGLVKRGGAVPELEGEAVPGLRDSGSAREFTVLGPKGTRVRVGRPVGRELAELNGLLALMIAAAVVLVLAALGGGWWIATRTLRPIRTMSEAAGKISASDLSRRIDPDGVPAELRDLALTLNDAFERLDSAFARQTRFTADVSHELRTPLSVIRSQVEQALRRERTGLEYRSALEACLRSVERMSRLVEQMLAFARIDAGGAQVAFLEVALDGVLQESVEEAAATARSAGVELRVKSEPVRVRGDPLQLAEVIDNLLSNAIRYNRPGGHVEVELGRSDGEARLSVSDDGVGIPEQALPHVFERFYQVDPARSRASGGAGLGLALARRIVQAHGGAITIESRVGSGSTFRVTLPAEGHRGSAADA